MSKGVGGEEREIRNTSVNAVWQKLWTHNWYIWLLFVVICHIVGTLHSVGHLSVSRRLSVNVTHVKLHEAGTPCVCTPSTNVWHINLSWKQYDSYSLGMFRVHSYWHLFVRYIGHGNAAVVEGVVGATNFRTRLGPIQLPAVPYRGVGAWQCGRHPLAQQGLVLWACTCQSVYWCFVTWCVSL
jgi:hypothetical protein